MAPRIPAFARHPVMARARPSPAAPDAATTPLSAGRRRLFVVITLALPWLVLALFELGLRVAGYGSRHPLFVASGQPGWLVPNPETGKRYFAAGPFTPTPEVEYFRERKTPATYRVMFQGESSAQGFPYGHGGMPSRMLERRLQAAFPEREIEVVNVALTAVNSYTLLDQADAIIAQRPDAVLIYTGHNEYYGAFGAGAASGLGRSRTAVRAYLALRDLRLVQLLVHLLGAGDTRRAGGDAPRTVMQLMAGEQRIPLGSPRYERGLAQFRANMGDLLARYRAAGIPVLIATVASNERHQPPFITGFLAGTDTVAWRRQYDAGVTALARGDLAAAEGPLRAAVAMDSTAAAGWYALARLMDARDDRPRALEAYRRAGDLDELRFRAPAAINDIIRDQGGRHGATIVDAHAWLQRMSRSGYIDSTLMLEHLHPNVDGYFGIADAFYNAMRERRMIGDWGAVSVDDAARAQARTEVAITPLDSMVGLLRTDRLTSYWPFQPRGRERTPIVDTLAPTTTVAHLARGVVLGELPWAEATERLRAAAERSGDLAMARRAATALAQEYAWSPAPLLDLARLAMREGDERQALAHANAALARGESAEALQLAGLLQLRLGDHASAMRALGRAAALAPGDRRAVGIHRAAGAIPDLEAAATRAPRDSTALYNLALAYALTQQEVRAREVLGRLRAVAPAHAMARELEARLSTRSTSADRAAR